MMNMLSLVIFSVLLCSCIHMSTPNRGQSTPPAKLTRTIKAQNELIQNLKDQNRVLQQQVRDLEGHKPVHPAAEADSLQTTSPVRTQTIQGPSENGEHLLYSKVISSYRAQQREELTRSIELLAKGYPQSVHLDNAFYLAGLLEVSQGRYLQAERWFDRVLREQPGGNKAVSALFGKAIAEKKQKKWAEARRLLAEVQNLYPGSGEAQRAALEMKLIDSQNKDVIR